MVLAGLAVQVALVELANQAVLVASVVLENPGEQEALGNPAGPVVPAALDQRDVPEAARNRRHVRVEVAAATRWEIVAFPRVRVRAAEDLAAEVATLRARVAAVVARAWAAAVTVVAVVVTVAIVAVAAAPAAEVGAAAAAGVVAEVGDK